MKFLKRFFVKILVESVVGSLVSEALVAADEPKEDVWKGVLRLQTREDCIDDESGQKFDFPRCQLRSFLPSFLPSAPPAAAGRGEESGMPSPLYHIFSLLQTTWQSRACSQVTSFTSDFGAVTIH